MTTSHHPTGIPDRRKSVILEDPIDRALDVLARAGIGFEVLSECSDVERAA